MITFSFVVYVKCHFTIFNVNKAKYRVTFLFDGTKFFFRFIMQSVDLLTDSNYCVMKVLSRARYGPTVVPSSNRCVVRQMFTVSGVVQLVF